MQEFHVKQITKSLVHLRAEKEGHTIPTLPGLGLESKGSQRRTPTNNSSRGGLSFGQHGSNPSLPGEKADGRVGSQEMSRGLYSHDSARPEIRPRRSLSDMISEIIYSKLSTDFNQDLGVLNINNDLINSFFANIHMLSTKLLIAIHAELWKRVINYIYIYIYYI